MPVDGASDAAAQKTTAAAPALALPHLSAAPRSADAQQRLSAIHHRFTILRQRRRATMPMEKPTPINSTITLRITHPEKSAIELCEIECGAGTTLDDLKDQICAKTGLQARILVMAKRYDAGGDLDEAQRAALRAQAYVNWVRGLCGNQIRRRTASARWRGASTPSTRRCGRWRGNFTPSSRRVDDRPPARHWYMACSCDDNAIDPDTT